MPRTEQEPIGTSTCSDCSTVVYVFKNRAGKCYYFCPKCRVEHRHHTAVGSARFEREKVNRLAPETPAPAAGNLGETPPPEPPKSIFSSLMIGG